MIWMNLNVALLRAPEFLGSEPVARATWLCVLGYCIDQENGGRIENCADWKDRQWQQTCGVTRDEVMQASPLLTWSDNDLIVWQFPIHAQKKCLTNRENGRKGGLSKSQAKSEASRLNGAKHNPSEYLSVDLSESEALTQRKGKGKGKDKDKDKGNDKIVGADDSAPNDEEWLTGLSNDPAYAGIDVRREFAKMRAWCDVNRKQPSRRRFINWLNRAEKPMAAVAHTQDTFGSVRPNLENW
jgi:hypothetical protein